MPPSYQWQPWREGIILLLVAPFLLFPTVSTVAVTLALLLLVITWILPLLTSRRPLLPPTPFNTIFLLWSITLMISISVTADPSLTLPKITGLLLGFSTWRYLVWTVQDKKWIAISIIGFIILTLGIVFWGILGVGWANKIPFMEAVITKLPSSLIQIPESPKSGISANQLAGSIEILIIFSLSLLIGWKPKTILVKIIILFLFASLAGLLFITQSRSGWIGGIGGTIILLLLWGSVLPSSKKRMAIWLTLALFVGVGLFGAIQVGPEKIQNLWEEPAQETVIGNLGSVNFRKEVWRWAIVGVQDFPFTGMGLGTFREVVRRLYPLNITPTYDIAHAHNIFLQVALDIGLIGLITYIALLMVASFIGWQTARKNESLRPFSLGLVAGIAALHIYGLTDAIALGAKPGLIFWVALGLIAAMHSITSKQIATDSSINKV